MTDIFTEVKVFDRGDCLIVSFTIGNQTFHIPQIQIDDEDNFAQTNFMARMLVIALENLKTGDIEKAREMAYKQFPVE